MGNYLRLIILTEQGYGDMVLSESVDYFYKMAQRTGTLWEHDQVKASLNHGFASSIACIIYSALKNR